MSTYAAIPVDASTIIELFAHVADVPDGKSRLAWALFKFPWDAEDEFFFIGGNFLARNQPDFMRQIVSQSQLDKWFVYNPAHINRNPRNRPRKNGSWFTVTVRAGAIFNELPED